MSSGSNDHPSGRGPLPRLPALAWPRSPALLAGGNQPSADPAPASAPEENIPARPEPPPRFLTVPEAAEILGVSEKTVRRRIADGGLCKAPLGGRIIRIPATELRRLGRS